ncbi:MAG: biotin--[acetyl-CoA-carboxylase] ligase [Bacteroidota bacterium]
MPLKEFNTLFIGKVLFEFQSLESTNISAQELLSKSKPTEGTVISASEQTKGKGQFGSTWLSSPAENITLSIILYPGFLPPNRQFLLNQAISLGVYDLCNAYLEADVCLKWPNDILFGNNKAGGILIENTISGNQISATVIGVGLNINQTVFPNHLPNPVSWRDITGTIFDLEEVKQALFWHVEARYLQLRAGHYDRLRNDYIAALYRYAQRSPFKSGDQKFTGKITGVNQDGKLELVDDKGELKTFGFKEIEFDL